MKKLSNVAFAFCILLFSFDVLSQWESDVRLTNAPSYSYTSYNNVWCIASSGSVLHVVWYDNRDGNPEIYYKRSTDGGLNWSVDTRLTNNTGVSWFPSVSVSVSLLHVVWRDDRDGNDEIYYKRSTDGGVSWSVDTRLTNNTAFSSYPSVSVSGSVVHVVWDDLRDGNDEIYYKRSTDGGVSWSADTRLTNNTADSRYPSISVSGSVVHVVWDDLRDGNEEIYYKRSTDGGVSWSVDTRLTNNTGVSWFPSVSVSGSVIHVVWIDNRNGNDEIYYKLSTDGGINWSADTRLTNNTGVSWFPSVSVSGSVVHVVWMDNRDGNDEIYYKRSTDGGVSWSSDTRLTNNTSISAYASVTVSGSVVHVVWSDNRDGNFEIYYKRNPTGNPVGIKKITSELPVEYKLYQNYPNPFNPTTTIRFDIAENSNVILKIYDLLGSEVSLLVNDFLEAGTYEYQWDAGKYSSGVYYYTIRTDKFFQTKKLNLIR